MKELVVLSGKGGTGKTSIVASFAHLAENAVLADCDVDAADLHLILKPEIIKKDYFFGGNISVLNKDQCIECGKCLEVCRFDAISESYDINKLACEGCGVCAYFCPVNAIQMIERASGMWYISNTKNGPFIHATLGIAEGNSGKMVSHVKEMAREITRKDRQRYLIVDGPPGIGCPVIASLSGAHLLLIVCEPTVSGIHDLKRLVELSSHFKTKTIVCINKFDINHDNVIAIEDFCSENNISIVGKIPYDNDFSQSQVESLSIVEYSNNEAAQNIRSMWDKISNELL